MFKELSQLETNLRRAGYTLLVEMLGGALLAFLLSQLGLEAGFAILFVWVVNLPAAWFLAQAAKLQGRNAWITGAISILPLFALLQFLLLCAHASRSKQAL